MAKRKRNAWDRLRTAFKANDEAAFEEELTNAEDEMEGEGPQRVVIELKTPESTSAADEPVEEQKDEAPEGDDRMSKLEATVAQLVEAVGKLAKAETAEVETGDEDPEKAEEPEVNDEEPEVEKQTAMDALAKAEILAPGIKLPTFDGAKVKGQAVTRLRREALRRAFDAQATRPHVTAMLGGRKAVFDTMAPELVAVVFDGAAALTAAANNSSATRHRPADLPQGPMTADRMQQRITEWRKNAH